MPRPGRSSSDERQQKAQSGGLEEKRGEPKALASNAITSASPDRQIPKFDRNAYHQTYMKDYMRKRRAKLKDQKK